MLFGTLCDEHSLQTAAIIRNRLLGVGLGTSRPQGSPALEVEGEEFEEIKGESETIAGLLLEIKGGFPKKGEIIKLQNYVLTVEHMDEKRIHRIKLEVK